MPRGINENKRRNAASRDAWARGRHWKQLIKQMPLVRVVREDGATGAIEITSRSKFSSEVCWFMAFAPVRARQYSMPEQLAWEELKRGATFYTEKARFWIERDSAEGGEFYEAEEIERIYQDVV